MTYGATAGLIERVAKGETFDVAVLTKPAMDDLVKQGKVAAQGSVDVARAGIGVAMRPGAPRPDLSSTEAFKKTMLNAKSVAYTDPAGGGGSGVYAGELVKRLGIADEMKPKTRLAPAGTSSARLVASGEAEFAIQTISELVLATGIEVAGPLPPELQMYTVMSAGIGATASDKVAAQRLVDTLASPALAPVLRNAGLEPAK
jgi:molybdate transport system substrate-binding protein